MNYPISHYFMGVISAQIITRMNLRDPQLIVKLKLYSILVLN